MNWPSEVRPFSFGTALRVTDGLSRSCNKFEHARGLEYINGFTFTFLSLPLASQGHRKVTNKDKTMTFLGSRPDPVQGFKTLGLFAFD